MGRRDAERATARVAAAGIIAGVGGLATQLLVVNALTVREGAQFLVFWSLLFGAFGLLAGVQNETTRATASARTDNPRHPRVVPVGLGIGTVMALLLAATGPLWSGRVSTGASDTTGAALVVATVALGTLAFSGEVAVLGALAGTGRWTDYALLSGGEAVVRLLLVVLVTMAGASLLGLEVATAAAAATWLALLLARPCARRTLAVRADRPLRPFLRSTLLAMAAAVGTSVLVTGYAVLIDLTTPTAVVEGSAAFLLAVSLTRATLLMPMYALQGMVIAAVVRRPRGAARLLARGSAFVVGVGALGAGLAWLLGPWLLDLLRPGYRVEGPVFAGLMGGAICLALLVLGGAVCLGLDRHGRYVAGWAVAVVVALAVLLAPLPLEPRVIASLVAGPLVGAVVHASGVVRAGT